MIRMIFTQLWNNRRGNAWLAVELLLVFCLLWYMVDFFFLIGHTRGLPTCRSVEHTWQVGLDQLPDTHPDYQPGESDSTALEANFARVLDRIRQCDGVEGLAVFTQASSPASGGFWGLTFRTLQDTSRVRTVQSVYLDPAEDFFRVFAYTDAKGNPVSVYDFDWSAPHAVVVGNMMAEALFATGNPIGQAVEETDETHRKYKLTGVVGDIKRFDYDRPEAAAYLPIRVNAGNIKNMEIAVRSRASQSDEAFLAMFTEKMILGLRIGNFYLYGVNSYTKLQAEVDTLFGQTAKYQSRTLLMLFFFLNTLLCVAGTFWYRVNTRRGEIGVHRAMGASRQGIIRLLLLEGLCLLLLVALPAMLIEAQFVYAGLTNTQEPNAAVQGNYLPDHTLLRFLITNVFTLLWMACIVSAGIYFPARAAADMNPVEALRDE